MQHPKLDNLTELVALRQEIHQYPEVSGAEQATAARIVAHLQRYEPDELHTQLGGTGIAAVFYGEQPSEGPTVLFRAELDALPIAETNKNLSYCSTAAGVGHKCGHDGHMAILTALASLLHRHKPARGKAILLYQPAEETGAGAFDILQDERMEKLKPDYVFALHNLPGVELHQVVIRNDVFAAASTGMVIELQGKSSHAAEPENGLNPAKAMAEIILAFDQILQQKEQFRDLALLTVIHAKLGEVAFGTNPGFATVMATLRSFQPEDFALLKQLAIRTVEEKAQKYNLSHSIRFVEEFPATVNNAAAVDVVQKAAQQLGLDIREAVQPFRWSEDFGHFTAKAPGALFGLGSGLEQPQLHHSDYDFPDEIIPTGASLFYRIFQALQIP